MDISPRTHCTSEPTVTLVLPGSVEVHQT